MRTPSFGVARRRCGHGRGGLGSGHCPTDSSAIPSSALRRSGTGWPPLVLVAGLRAARRPIPVPRGRDWVWLVLLAATGQGLYNVCDRARGDVRGTGSHRGWWSVSSRWCLTLAEAIRRRARPTGLDARGCRAGRGRGRSCPKVQDTAQRSGVGWAVLALRCEAGFTLLALPILGRLGPFGVTIHTCWIAAAQLGVLAFAVRWG